MNQLHITFDDQTEEIIAKVNRVLDPFGVRFIEVDDDDCYLYDIEVRQKHMEPGMQGPIDPPDNG